VREPRDGDLQVSPIEFIGYVLGAIALVVIVWVVAVFYLVTFS